MGRDDDRVGANGSGEDRLSALLAGALVATNLVGGGLLVLLKALDVRPMVPGQVSSREVLATWMGPVRPGDPAADPARADRPAGVARGASGDQGRWRR